MTTRQLSWVLAALAVLACGDDSNVEPVVPTTIEAFTGDEQTGTPGAPLSDPLVVLVTDAEGSPVRGVQVSWSVLSGGGAISPAASTTDEFGAASAALTLGPAEGDQQARAEVNGLAGSPVVFNAHATSAPLIAAAIEAVGGTAQNGPVGAALPESLRVRVIDAQGRAVPGVAVGWSVSAGGGSISPNVSATNGSGIASAEFILGPAEGEHRAQADVGGLIGSPVVFTALTISGTGDVVLSVRGGGNNVQEHNSSDLWVHGNYAYTGTWGFRTNAGGPGDELKVWSLDASGAPVSAGSVTVPGIDQVSDVQVSEAGDVLVLSGEHGDGGGIFIYGLSDPARPNLLGSANIGARGVHTVTLSTIAGRQYAFAAMNPGFTGDETEDMSALMIYDITAPASPTLVRRVPVENHYSIHDTFVRDGLAFVFAWDEGVIIYDVGNGIRGGSPAAPVEVSRLVTAGNGNSPAVHNGWWFHNPVTGEQRYLFIGQEGPGQVGARSSGDIHVVDVSDLTNPREVAFFHLDGAGVHNFWMDEARQVLYAAYYNAGVIALDVSGTLTGNLSNRLLSQLRPGGTRNTYTWGVQLAANGSLYAIDMLSGLWQLGTE